MTLYDVDIDFDTCKLISKKEIKSFNDFTKMVAYIDGNQVNMMIDKADHSDMSRRVTNCFNVDHDYERAMVVYGSGTFDIILSNPTRQQLDTLYEFVNYICKNFNRLERIYISKVDNFISGKTVDFSKEGWEEALRLMLFEIKYSSVFIPEVRRAKDIKKR